MDAEGLRHHIVKVREGFLDRVIIPLVGIFKGGTGSRHHLQFVMSNTASKLNISQWM